MSRVLFLVHIRRGDVRLQTVARLRSLKDAIDKAKVLREAVGPIVAIEAVRV